MTTECLVCFVGRRIDGDKVIDDIKSLVIHSHDQTADLGAGDYEEVEHQRRSF